LAAACSEDGPVTPADGPNPRVVNHAADQVEEFPGEERASPFLTLAGPYVPGVPLSFEWGLDARHSSIQTLAVVVLDEEDPAHPGRPAKPRTVAQFGGPMAAGAARRVRGQVRFERPGYYRLLAIASGLPLTPADRDREQGKVLDQADRTLWVVIDSTSGRGRLTNGYDPTVLAERSLMFGAFGPFQRQEAGDPRSDAVATSVGSITGRVWYRNHHPEPDSLSLLPVPDALISAVCYDFNSRPTSTQRTARTDASGYFSVQCLSNHAGARVSWSFSNGYADVKGANGAAAGGITSISNGGYRDLISINDHAARVYLRLSQYIPVGNARFGRSRGPVQIWASNLPADSITRYVLSADRIEYGSRRVFGADGEFVVMHEYGHAYHYYAIEPYTQNCPSPHPIDALTNFNCAFHEAFADVYAVWLAGARMPPPAFYSGRTIEQNQFRGLGDGARIQGAVGGFLLDLVDDVGDPDFVTGDDDGVTYPASYLAAVMQTCRFDFPLQLTIDTVDRLVYCAERNLGAGAGSPYGNWQRFGYFSELATEPVSGTPRYHWSPTAIRALWRYNLFNLGALP
jgi:hypothetical protein